MPRPTTRPRATVTHPSRSGGPAIGSTHGARKHVVTDPRFIRPAEVDLLLADPSKARRDLDWTPKVGFVELVAMMVDADLERLSARK